MNNSRVFNKAEQQILEEIMTLRRDVRGNHFTNQAVEPQIVQKLLSVAAISPSVGFSQPWEFVVIRDEQIKAEVVDNYIKASAVEHQAFDDANQVKYNRLKLEGILEAPVNIAVFYKSTDEVTLGQTSMPEMGEYSVVCAVQNMWLMGRAMNIGIGWVSILDPESIKQTLNAPDDLKLVAYLCVGYVDQFLPKPELELLQWKKRKALEEVINYDRFKSRVL